MAVKPLPLQEQWIRVLLETDTITYTATDAAGNTGNATRTVTVVGSGGGESFGDVVIYANNSTTLIGQVTIEGEVAESGDVVAIYVGSELRGKQEVIINGGVAWVSAQVNAAGGNETISFKVYDASTGVTHEKSTTSAVITTGGAVGSFVSPLMIEMKDPNGDPVVDTTAPVITVTPGNDTVEQGATWTNAGATADGQESVTSSGTVDANTLGNYTITYTATDAAGNTVTATRTVTVVDTTAPVITVTSGNDTVERGGSWTDAGATADGGETVTASGTVDTSAAGN